MRLSFIVALAMLGLASCTVNGPPPSVAPATVVTPPTTTYVQPAPGLVPGPSGPGTTVITR